MLSTSLCVHVCCCSTSTMIFSSAAWWLRVC